MNNKFQRNRHLDHSATGKVLSNSRVSAKLALSTILLTEFPRHLSYNYQATFKISVLGLGIQQGLNKALRQITAVLSCQLLPKMKTHCVASDFHIVRNRSFEKVMLQHLIILR